LVTIDQLLSNQPEVAEKSQPGIGNEEGAARPDRLSPVRSEEKSQPGQIGEKAVKEEAAVFP